MKKTSEQMRNYAEICDDGKNTLTASGTLRSFIPNVEALEKEIVSLDTVVFNLKSQIEKMKNCNNCKYYSTSSNVDPCDKCSERNNWELL